MSEITTRVEGFIATDPTTSQTSTGKPVLSVSVAHTERRKNQQTGQWEDAVDKDGQKITTWARATFWEDEALFLAGQLSKGLYVVIEGDARVSAYLDSKTNTPRAQLEVHRAKLSIMPRAARSGPSGASSPGAAAQQSQDAWNAPQNGFDEQPF